jgi:hypothetical protein
MLVKNLNGTSDSPKCPCGSWLRHWMRYSGETVGLCAEYTCMQSAEKGAHVQKVDGEKTWYIIPLCTEHNNQRGQQLTISNSVALVPATDRSKCGR